jgi:hypothetical protein
MTAAEDEPRHDPKAGHHLDHEHDVRQTADSFRLSLPGAEAGCWKQVSALCPVSPDLPGRGLA